MNFNEINNQIDWDKVNGLIPAIIQNEQTGQVLMLGYMNNDALNKTLLTKQITFYSRTKQKLWVKGETSGNYLIFKKIILDCDNDTLLVLVSPLGPCCHKGTTSCFKHNACVWNPLFVLESIIKQRAVEQSDKSYTVSLLKAGMNRMTQKVGEEAVETIIAALNENDTNLCNEVADLFYHTLVLLYARGLSVENVFHILLSRQNASSL